MMTGMTGERMTLPGRVAELSTLDNALAGTSARRHTMVAVRGGPGTGKTKLLTTAADRWRARGVTVLTLSFRKNVPAWDIFGAGAVINALREHYTAMGDFSLAKPVVAAAELCTERAYGSSQDRSWLLARLSEAFEQLRNAGPAAVVADDVDAVPHPALGPACLPGYLVVAAGQDVTRLTADRIIDLTPPKVRTTAEKP
jgi:hypothetical protein